MGNSAYQHLEGAPKGAPELQIDSPRLGFNLLREQVDACPRKTSDLQNKLGTVLVSKLKEVYIKE